MYERGDPVNSFDEYVERYCKEWKIDREQALQHAIVKEIKSYYENAEKGKISVTEAVAGCGCMELDDKSC